MVSSSELKGGITSSVNAVRLADGREVVLRQWTDNPMVSEAAKPQHVRNEAAMLQRVATLPLPTPELVAIDPTGELSGGPPALVMTKLPGAVLLEPSEQWIHDFASALAVVHETNCDDLREFVWWIRPAELEIPSWSTRPEIWRDAIAVANDPNLSYEPCFIHRDWQHFNVLWLDTQISGVVDWIEASRGPSGIDVGHCRRNLAALFSPEVAEDFLTAYEDTSGSIVDSRWDIVSLLGHLPRPDPTLETQVSGRRSIDWAGMNDRLETVLAHSLHRLG